MENVKKARADTVSTKYKLEEAKKSIINFDTEYDPILADLLLQKDSAIRDGDVISELQAEINRHKKKKRIEEG